MAIGFWRLIPAGVIAQPDANRVEAVRSKGVKT